MQENNWYVYYSYEQWGRGYIGYRGCEYEKGYTPETEPYWGTYSNKTFKPTEKIILFQNLTQEEALEIEIYLHNFYDIDRNDHFANKAKQTSTGFRSNNTGKIRINNGIKEKNIPKNTKIPEGYFLGGLPKSKEQKQKQSEAKKGENNPNYGKIIINNGIIEKRIPPDCDIPDGFSIGRLKETLLKCQKANNNKKWINNGIKELFILLDEEILEGFILGRLNSGENHYNYGKTHSEETLKKQSEIKLGAKNPNYGKIWYTDGLTEKLISHLEEVPEGFIKGRKKIL